MSASTDTELAYRGTIVRYSVATGRGLVRSASGREIPFDKRFVKVSRPFQGNSPELSIEEGLAVGFDVGWTSRGLQISRIFDSPEALEGKAGEEGEVATDEGTRENEYQLDIE